MRERILFIVNPISGGQEKTFIPSLVDQFLDHNIFDAEIIFTERVGHATKLAEQAIKDGFDIIASVGGDGTINEIASVLESTGKRMAIIPSGSGNGLARTLNIPLNKAKAIKNLNNLKTTKIDSGIFNDKKFFNMAGMGFDAHISALFATNKTRGFKGYVKTAFDAMKTYQPRQYKITVDGNVFIRKAFMVSIANSSQYGNNAHISPFASLTDGLLDVCVIKRFSIFRLPLMGLIMFAKMSHRSNYLEIFKGKNIKIERESKGPIHVDGEPFNFPEEISISVNHLSLTLLV